MSGFLDGTSPIPIRRHEVTLLPESSRVIIRPFIPDNSQRITTIIGRALSMSEKASVIARVSLDELLAGLRG